jgi:competence protein ComEC
VAYVAFLGWPAPATRAAVLAVLAALSLLRQRRVRPTPLLALTCLLVVLGDPWAVFDLGGWLSAAALWGASTFSRWGEQAIGPGLAGRTLFASIGATLATAPISAAMFGTVALAGIGLNFAAIPLAAVAVPGILASLLALPVLPEVARSFAAGSGLALAGLERLALAGAAIPGGAITTPTGWPGALTWGGVLVLACWITADRTPWRESAWRMAWVAAAILWIPPAATEWRSRHDGEGRLALFFLAVGQGDAIAIRTPGGHWVLVDVGPAGEGRDAGRQVVAPFLRRHGVRRVALLLVSHGHADHLGGAGAILQRYQVDAAMEPGWPLRDSLYQGFLADLAAEEARWSPARAGDRWQLDGVRFSVLHPDTTWSGWGEDLNEDSVVLLVEFGGFRALLTGDAGLPVERRLRGRVGAVDLLKAGHHGSRTATGAGWLAELDPRAVVLSVGRNRYGHPAPAVLNQVASQGASLWRTDQDGTVQVNTDGCRVAVTAGRRTLDYRIEREPCHAGQP